MPDPIEEAMAVPAAVPQSRVVTRKARRVAVEQQDVDGEAEEEYKAGNTNSTGRSILDKRPSATEV